MQSRNWETSNGEKRSALEVVARRVQFLGRKAPRAGVDVGEGERGVETGPVVEERNSEGGGGIGQENARERQENS